MKANLSRLTVRQAAEHAGTSPSLVYLWCAERRLPHLRTGRAGRRGKILIDQEDLDTFLDSLRVESEEVMEPELRHINRRLP